ncbi:phosphodiester glycosidase family protein [Agathobacter sp.]
MVAGNDKRSSRGTLKIEVAYVIILIVFTVYMLLDTFVITQKMVVVDTSQTSDANSSSSGNSSGAGSSTLSGNSSGNTSGSSGTASGNTSESNNTSSGSTSSGTVTSTATTYEDDNIKITITDYRENDTDIHVADITVSSSEYLKTAFAENAYGRNVTEKTSDIAESVNAILAINGDFYGAQESGYVIRNGVIYRSTAKSGNEDLVIYADGSFEIINEDDVTAEELLADGAQNILAFGPALVEDGKVSVTEDEEVGKAMASNPRTAIGIIDENHYVFVVADGRTSENEGLSLYELAEFMESLGVQTAYNLDGGGSSTMYFNGQIINQPTTNGNTIKERSVSDIVYIGY